MPELCQLTPIAVFGVIGGVGITAVGLMLTVAMLMKGQRSDIKVAVATILTGVTVGAASLWIVAADLSRPWQGNGEPPCPNTAPR